MGDQGAKHPGIPPDLEGIHTIEARFLNNGERVLRTDVAMVSATTASVNPGMAIEGVVPRETQPVRTC